MLQYKVVHVDIGYQYIRYDGQKIDMRGKYEEEIQEEVLNHLAQYGWRLVQAVHEKEEEMYLYLERQV